MVRTYRTAADFRQALDAHLRSLAQSTHADLARLRQRYVFERLLARLAAYFGDRVVLKGGLALELRLGRARATRDVDLRVSGNPGLLASELARAGAVFGLDGDFLTFEIDLYPKFPTIDGEGMLYQGQRFRVMAMMGGKIYGSAFGVDVAMGDRMSYRPELLVGARDFEFAGIPPIQVLAYAREVHLAEKLHAFTMPRPRPNSRVKDLPDMTLLGLTGPFESSAIMSAIKDTFIHRATHPIPAEIPAPPMSWDVPYGRMAQEDRLPWATLTEVAEAARAFLNPVLCGNDGIWAPASWSWQESRCSHPP
ncbi:MAG: nucleotidyl transferase AbiEii/AbiGii toxin family protein [Byssovorax sp.]